MNSSEDPTTRQLFSDIADAMGDWLDDDSSGHDMDHAWRVFSLGIELAETEGADSEVVGAAALTHDIHRAMEENGESVDPVDTLPEVRAILEQTNFPEEKIDAVEHCVAVHDEYEFRGSDRPAETIEAEILRDADNLDAMGAIGIARCFAFTGVDGRPLWDPQGSEYSGLYHFEDKLFRLRDEMNTETAREMAEDRHTFMMEFVDRFKQEWNGEDRAEI
jgi:uncharacterized protein